MSIPAAIVGAQTRLSSYLIIEFVFGKKGLTMSISRWLLHCWAGSQ